MSPLDDELRTALSSRTESVVLSPDFVGGVERRARRMRRNRVAASVAGSALAATALGLGGPIVASSLTATADRPTDRASAEPGPESAGPYALDPANPWPYRGDDALLSRGTRQSLIDEWSARREGPGSLAPLYGEVYEPSQQSVVVFTATDRDGDDWWGVATSSESGWDFLVDTPLAGGTLGLAAALPGDEVSRLLVVASPDVSAIDYAPDGSAWSATGEPAPGVGAVALDGDPAADRYRVRSPAGEVLVDAPAPDAGALVAEPEGPGPEPPAFADSSPYALDVEEPWGFRGDTAVRDALAPEAGRLLGGYAGRTSDGYTSEPLLAGTTASDDDYLVVLHTSLEDDQALVTTTWRSNGSALRQAVQPVTDGQLLVQSFLPDVGPAGVLLALASPLAGAVETELVPEQPTGVTRGVGIFELPADPPPGRVFLYAEGEGLLYHSEPARRS